MTSQELNSLQKIQLSENINRIVYFNYVDFVTQKCNLPVKYLLVSINADT